jgi:hypothetical protein
MPELVLEIAHRHSVIETTDSERVSKQVWMDTVPLLARLVLAFDLLRRFVRNMHTPPPILNSCR